MITYKSVIEEIFKSEENTLNMLDEFKKVYDLFDASHNSLLFSHDLRLKKLFASYIKNCKAWELTHMVISLQIGNIYYKRLYEETSRLLEEQSKELLELQAQEEKNNVS